MPTMYNPIAVANYFIGKAFGEGANITPMQAIKLVYIAHGWHLALTSNPLIGESVEAWKFGPVIPSVYHAFKKYGRSPIMSAASTIGSICPTVDDEEQTKLLDVVWDLYKNLSGEQLSALTHKEGSPWYRVWEDERGKNIRNAAIPNLTIKEYYSNLLRNAESKKSA